MPNPPVLSSCAAQEGSASGSRELGSGAPASQDRDRNTGSREAGIEGQGTQDRARGSLDEGLKDPAACLGAGWRALEE